MSLINQMLQDLEQRRANTATATPLGGVSAGSGLLPGGGRINYLLLGVVLVLAVVVAFLMGLQRADRTQVLSVVPTAGPETDTAQPEQSTLAIEAPVVSRVETSQPRTQATSQTELSLQAQSRLQQQPETTEPTAMAHSVEAHAVPQVAPQIQELQVRSVEDRTRILVEIDRRVNFQSSMRDSDNGKSLLVLHLAGTQPFTPTQRSFAGTPVGNVTSRQAKGTLQLQFHLTAPLQLYRSAMEDREGGARLVVELRALPAVNAESLDSEVLPSPAEQIEKTVHPLSDAQRAEQLFQRGVTELGSGDRSQAGLTLQSALEIDPAHGRSRETLAALMLNEGRVAEAAAVLSDGLRLTPQATALAKLYARILAEQGDSAAAIAVLEQAQSAGNNDTEYLALLAAFYQREQRHVQAAQTYQRVLQLRPAMASWWMGLALSMESLGESATALAAYQRAQQLGGLSRDVRTFVAERIRLLSATASQQALHQAGSGEE
jgi:tetratricopeptide (TPR) repeat protein